MFFESSRGSLAREKWFPAMGPRVLFSLLGPPTNLYPKHEIWKAHFEGSLE
jgi:hypothetical protein